MKLIKKVNIIIVGLGLLGGIYAKGLKAWILCKFYKMP